MTRRGQRARPELARHIKRAVARKKAGEALVPGVTDPSRLEVCDLNDGTAWFTLRQRLPREMIDRIKAALARSASSSR